MRDHPETLTVEIGKAPPVPRSGGDEELAAIDRLMAYCDSNGSIDREYIESFQRSITPWVAQQAGVLAEKFDSEGTPIRATRMAFIASIAARWSGDPVRLSANMLTAANILFKNGKHDLAVTFYGAILELPFLGAKSERIGAHLGLANYYFFKGNFRDAAYHYDKFLPSLDELLIEPAKSQILIQAARAYAECPDFAGVLFCGEKSERIPTAKVKADLSNAKVKQDEALLIVARLKALGCEVLAEEFRSLWTKI
jgi:hypothetical protein